MVSSRVLLVGYSTPVAHKFSNAVSQLLRAYHSFFVGDRHRFQELLQQYSPDDIPDDKMVAPDKGKDLKIIFASYQEEALNFIPEPPHNLAS